MKWLLWLVPPLYLLDQWSKWLVVRHIDPDFAQPVIPGFFNLVQVHNTGAAFGIGKNSNFVFIGLSLVVLAVLGIQLARGAFKGAAALIPLSLLIAGILGNVTDRFVRRHVIDFLDFYIGTYHWPAFNVADSCICVAVGLFFLFSFAEERKERRLKASS